MWSFAKNIQTQLAMPEEYTFYINLIMHTSGMLERILRNDTLTVSEKELGQLVQEPIYPVIVASIETMEEALNMDVPTEEVYFIAQLVKNAQCIEDKITEIDTLD